MQSISKIKSFYKEMTGEQRLRALLSSLGDGHNPEELSDIVASFKMDWSGEKVINKKNFNALIELNDFLFYSL